MADGLPPIKAANYGDKIKVENLAAGFKHDPASDTADFASRTGGRPRTEGGAQRPASAAATPSVVPPEETQLFEQAAAGLHAHGYVTSWAQIPGADPRFALIAQAGGVHGALEAARNGSPFYNLGR